ncbi:shikimate kinase AroK [Sedimenticola selenatireducens]|jgi:shikimate kinase|uniref:Shikimate kinase n=1 Tax=Sedimenticola selenatireducens TaxID=191960 RepID=A0A557SH93_9GAMM|nr:shikimate kinase AroK [Sedimenticola selenatireducens]TVO76767.1 shikimate kinase AroK [Sedimenticola selenatireducens]TVT64210.1 MAG: shikimate kinase AroK [Sedimenticola selenatireducens]
MNHPNNIFLVGPMGAGKSTIGRQVATLLGLDFDDTDHEIQRRTGVDIPTIFDFEGEEGFRKRESAVIDDLTQRGGLVLATGGGSILNPENRRNLSSRGFVVYLYCSPEQQYERTLRDRSRPLLQTEDPLGTLQALMSDRDPLYRETADIVITSEKRSATAVANEIVRKLRSDIG